jgi:hypothetical protein
MASRDERERRAQERIEAQIAARFRVSLRREIQQSMREAADALESGGVSEVAITGHTERIGKLLDRMWRDSFTAIGERVLDQLSEKHGPLVESKQLSDTILTALDRWTRIWRDFKIQAISKATESQIRRMVSRGIAEGDGMEAIAVQIRREAPVISALRSEIITRTETHSAANAGSFEVAKESGVVRIKNWVHVDDDRVRDGDNTDFDHTNVASVPINEPFIVSGEELMYPGDPNASAGNYIRCRCAMTYSTR